LNQIAEKGDIIFITTPDDQIEAIAQKLLSSRAIKKDTLLVHTSGYHVADILRGGENDHYVLSAHPLLSVANWELARKNLEKAFFFLEGDEKGLEWGSQLLETIGVQWQEISAEDKANYHAAAVVFSNFLVTLINAGISLQEMAGIPRETGLKAAIPLLESTLRNVENLGAKKALTGPVARGDVGTVSGHLKALAENENLQEFYRNMSEFTLEIARERGLDSKKYENLKALLKEVTHNE